MATVRAATKEDITRILELYSDLASAVPTGEQSYPSTNDVQKVIAEMDAMPGHELLVAEENGAVVGTMVLLIVPNLSHRALPWATIENVVVDNEYRRRGIGRILMEYAIDRARRVGCYKIQLVSNKRRLEAHQFYQEMGFESSVYGFRLYL